MSSKVKKATAIKKAVIPVKKITPETTEKVLLKELAFLIDESQQHIKYNVNSAIALLFWHIGRRINITILQNKRADYGKRIVVTVSRQLSLKYGRNFEEKNLRRMLQFAELFPEEENVVTLSRHLSWSHFLTLIPLKTHDARLFYAAEIITGGLGVRELRRQISLKSFERAQIANAQSTATTGIPYNTFKDPFLLDFLNLRETYLESDLEGAILRELQSFILELGRGFAFIERQKRIIIDGDDFYIDLLFYNRNLNRLVAIELKLGKFEAKHKGQMELYLSWLNKYERKQGENSPIGLILCAESSREQVELLETEKSGIMVSEYWRELPPKKEFKKKIHNLLLQAKERIEQKKILLEQ
jgi:predicted nuclease of restriction endonuclease-like (RecB) superfamily